VLIHSKKGPPKWQALFTFVGSSNSTMVLSAAIASPPSRCCDARPAMCSARQRLALSRPFAASRGFFAVIQMAPRFRFPWRSCEIPDCSASCRRWAFFDENRREVLVANLSPTAPKIDGPKEVVPAFKIGQVKVPRS